MTEVNQVEETISDLRRKLGADRLDNYGSSILVKELLDHCQQGYIHESDLAIVSVIVDSNWSDFHEDVALTFNEINDYLGRLARCFTGQYRENLEGYNFGELVALAVLRKAVISTAQHEVKAKHFGRLFAESLRNHYVGSDDELIERMQYLLCLLEHELEHVPTGIFVDQAFLVISNGDE